MRSKQDSFVALTKRSAWAFKFGERGGRRNQHVPKPAQKLRPGGLPVALWRRFQAVFFENVRNGAPRDLVAQISQRTLDPPVAPIPVFRCHANHQVFSLIPGSGPTGPTLFAAVVLSGDQLPAPSQQRLRGNYCGNLMKDSTAKLFGLGGQAPTLVVVQRESLVRGFDSPPRLRDVLSSPRGWPLPKTEV